MILSANSLFNGNFTFQQDNDTKYTAKITKKYFENKRIIVLIGRPKVLTHIQSKIYGQYYIESLKISRLPMKLSYLTYWTIVGNSYLCQSLVENTTTSF